MCIPDLYNPFYFDLIKGASDVLEGSGYHIMLCHSKRVLHEELKIIGMLKERYGDGMLFLTFDLNETNVQALVETRMPVVTTNHIPFTNHLCYAHVDQMKAMHIATCHLIECGHTKIGALIGELNDQNSYERFAGYSLAMEEHGLQINEDKVIISNFTREHTRIIMNQRFSGGGPDMTALVAANTQMGIGCMDACAESGVLIPGDLSIISLDDTDVATCTNPRLSVIDMCQEEIGRKASSILLDQIEGSFGQRRSAVIKPKLISRESVRRI